MPIQAFFFCPHLYLYAQSFFLGMPSPIMVTKLRCCSSEGNHGQKRGMAN